VVVVGLWERDSCSTGQLNTATHLNDHPDPAAVLHALLAKKSRGRSFSQK
jgi:hypothetical protein